MASSSSTIPQDAVAKPILPADIRNKRRSCFIGAEVSAPKAHWNTRDWNILTASVPGLVTGKADARNWTIKWTIFQRPEGAAPSIYEQVAPLSTKCVKDYLSVEPPHSTSNRQPRHTTVNRASNSSRRQSLPTDSDSGDDEIDSDEDLDQQSEDSDENNGDDIDGSSEDGSADWTTGRGPVHPYPDRDEPPQIQEWAMHYSGCSPAELLVQYGLRLFVPMIVTFTNLHLDQNQSDIPRLRAAELYVVIGLSLIMAVIRVSNVRWYWRGQRRGDIPQGAAFSIPDFTEYMSYERFFQIRGMLKFADYTQKNEADTLWKVRSVLNLVRDIVRDGMPRLYTNQSADERRVPFKGRGPELRTLPNKPIKHGWTLIAASDNRTKYLWNFYVEDSRLTAENCAHLGWKMRGQQVLEHVSAALAMSPFNKGIHLYTDRLYTGLALAKEMRRRECHLTGVIQINRGVPDAVKFDSRRVTAQEPRGSLLVAHTEDNIHVWGVKDNSSVYLLDTFFGGSVTSQDSTRAQTKYDFPESKQAFNTNMGAVDAFDHMTANRQGFNVVSKNLKTKKWTVRLGFDAMLDLLHGDAFVIHRTIDPYWKLKHTSWLLNAGNGLLHIARDTSRFTGRTITIPVRTRSVVSPVVRTPQHQSHSMESPSNQQHGSVKIHKLLGFTEGRPCAWCRKQKELGRHRERVKVTVFGCADYREFLHPGTCHALYHRARQQNPSDVQVKKRKRKKNGSSANRGIRTAAQAMLSFSERA